MTGKGVVAYPETFKPKLRIGLILGGLQIASWQWELVQRLRQSDYAYISLVVFLERQGRVSVHKKRGLVSWLRSLVDAINDRLEARVSLEPNALAPRDASEVLADVPAIHAAPGNHDKLLPEIGSFEIDVLLDLSSLKHLPVLAAAKYGIWSLQHGDARIGFGDPPGFWEVFLRSPSVASSLLVADGGHGGKIIDRTFSSTDRTSVLRNNNSMYWRSVSLVPRRLRELHRQGPEALARWTAAHAAAPVGSMAPGRPPTPWESGRHVLRMCQRGLLDKIQDRIYLWQWILMFHIGDAPCTDMTRFRKMIPPKDRYWADPVVLARGGKYYIFIEEVPVRTGKGHISVIVMDEHGQYEAPVQVLVRPYHLSYPFVFEHGGETYMVPESMDNRTVELYRCVDFPLRWELVENLLENVHAVDATLIRHDGRWWLFANMADSPASSTWEELFLFHSDSLLGGHWTPHPLNPIVSDVMRARPAGPVYTYHGKLYRPAQDCSVRYGYGIRLQEITRLTEDDYAEIEVMSLLPTWDEDLIAMHTLAHAGRLTIVDALQPRSKI